jgi:hypothetical protein
LGNMEYAIADPQQWWLHPSLCYYDSNYIVFKILFNIRIMSFQSLHTRFFDGSAGKAANSV